MKLTYFDFDKTKNLIEEIFLLTFVEKIPFTSTILPIGLPSISFVYHKKQIATYKEKVFPLKSIVLTGQFYNSYTLRVTEKGYTVGISLHPTTLYKLLQIDMFQYYNQHVLLEDIDSELFKILNPIFLKHKENISELGASINKTINSLPIFKSDKYIKLIDTTINIIWEKEGLLNITEVLSKISVSQKTLENQFKKIVGITPGKYIRLWRFLKLMRKYESGKIKLMDLIQMYDYYDHSHFSKDFQLFMNETPQSYFQKENHLLEKYLKE